MSLAKDVEVLSAIPLFAKVNPAKLKLLAFTSERLEYLSGDELFHLRVRPTSWSILLAV